MSQRAL